jgi:hypothetical protein
MIRQLKQFNVSRLRGVGFVFAAYQPGREPRRDDTIAPCGVIRFPQRPEATVISAAIPLYFIAQNKNGFWLAQILHWSLHQEWGCGRSWCMSAVMFPPSIYHLFGWFMDFDHGNVKGGQKPPEPGHAAALAKVDFAKFGSLSIWSLSPKTEGDNEFFGIIL